MSFIFGPTLFLCTLRGEGPWSFSGPKAMALVVDAVSSGFFLSDAPSTFGLAKAGFSAFFVIFPAKLCSYLVQIDTFPHQMSFLKFNRQDTFSQQIS